MTPQTKRKFTLALRAYGRACAECQWLRGLISNSEFEPRTQALTERLAYAEASKAKRKDRVYAVVGEIAK